MPQMKLIHPIWFMETPIDLFLTSVVISCIIATIAVIIKGTREMYEYESTVKSRVIGLIVTLFVITLPVTTLIVTIKTTPNKDDSQVYKYVVTNEYPLLKHYDEYIENEDGKKYVHYYNSKGELTKENVTWCTYYYDDEYCIKKINMILENDIWYDKQELTEIHLGKEDEL